MRRSTLVLLALAIAVAAVIFLWERKQVGKAEREAGAQKMFQKLPPTDTFTRVERAGEAPLSAEKSGDGWNLSSPVKDIADRYGIEGVIDRLREASATRFIEKPDLKKLGLDPPRATWTLTAGAEVFKISMGTKAPLDEGVYLKTGDKTALAPAAIEETILRPLDDFRSKELAPTGEERLLSFRVQVDGSPPVSGTRTGDEWLIKEPFQDEGDFSKVESYLEDITLSLASSFIKDGQPSNPTFGLEKPRANIQLSYEKGKKVEIKVGADAQPQGGDGNPALQPPIEQLYVSVSGRPSIMTCPAKLLKNIGSDPWGLRSMSLFRHQPFDAESLTVEGGYRVGMKRDKEGRWTFEPATEEQKGKDASPVAEALMELRGTGVAEASSPEASASPFVTVTLKGKGFEEKLSIGSEADGKRCAMPGGRRVALLLDPEQWRRAELALKAVPLAPESQKKAKS